MMQPDRNFLNLPFREWLHLAPKPVANQLPIILLSCLMIFTSCSGDSGPTGAEPPTDARASPSQTHRTAPVMNPAAIAVLNRDLAAKIGFAEPDEIIRNANRALPVKAQAVSWHLLFHQLSTS